MLFMRNLILHLFALIIGYSKTQWELEKLLAKFLKVEDAICFSMGFATNSVNISCLANKVLFFHYLCYF